ncbi:amidase [Saccharopolyspora sp. HNM0986]|uniref:amidase n=1 Tax=Saccharopolyspora galaxeae TaxID=2781241 RepID=UPI00190CBCF8|nr:amidase [Saccharopolyspora sp. HNM0986]MBK0867710.1 amidase [Saccharopolyspora sp. HNM0986]
MHYSEYREHDGLGLAELIRTGAVPAAEVLEAAVARAEDVGPRLGALTQRLYDQARERVRGGAPEGPFTGVPFLLKDLHQEVAGLPSSGGSRALRTVPAAETAEVVRRWTDAGLVVFGRTNTPEFGAKPITEPAAFGPARNPWQLDRTPGGSSGGAAAAVAAGIVPLAGASDGGGSIRIPAACCGVFGLKAGRGSVPAGPMRGENFHGAALDGVVSRSVRDSAAALDCLAGPDPAGPFAAAAPERSFAEEVTREPAPLRIGFTAVSALGDPHPEAVRAMTDAAELLTSLGHHVEEVPPPVDLSALAVDFLQAWSVRLAAALDEAARHAPHSSFELDTRLLAAAGRSTGAAQYVSTLDRWHQHTRRLAEFHQHHDLLLTPSLAGPPLRIGELDTPKALQVLGKAALALRGGGLLRRSGVVDRVARGNLRHVPYTQLANITGRPAMSVPLHWTPEGLPLGVQFVAPLAGEGTLFQLAGQLEQARPWAGHEPPLRAAAHG